MMRRLIVATLFLIFTVVTGCEQNGVLSVEPETPPATLVDPDIDDAPDDTSPASATGNLLAFFRLDDASGRSGILGDTATGEIADPALQIPDTRLLNAALSPDRSKLAFSGDHRLAVLDFESGLLTELDAISGITPPFWSPDSIHVAFRIPAPNSTDDVLKVVNVQDGSVQIVQQAASIDNLGWSGDGAILAYTIDDENLPEPWGVSVYSPATDQRAKFDLLDYVPDSVEMRWSPVGQKLIVGIEPPLNAPPRFFVFNLEPGRFLVRFEDAVGMFSALADMVWSPDGETLAVAGTNPSQEGFVLALDGSEATEPNPITGFNSGAPRKIAWSPDGNRLAVKLNDENAAGQSVDRLFVVKPNSRRGGKADVFSDIEIDLLLSFKWSASGDQIAALIRRTGVADNELYLSSHVNPRRRVGAPSAQTSRVIVDASNGDARASLYEWSPQGESLAYTSGDDDNGRRTLHVLAAEDDALLPLTFDAGETGAVDLIIWR